MAEPVQKVKYVRWFHKASSLKEVQWHYRVELEVNPLSKPFIYVHYTQFCEILQSIDSSDKCEFHVTRALRVDVGCSYETHLLQWRVQPIFV
jgi:hypothetical protein